MTRDDKVGKTARARQNVVFELGYCFGAFDSLDDRGKYLAEDAVIVVAETGVEWFADIEGLMRIEFKRHRLADEKDAILKNLKSAYKKARKFYPELS
jgi:predicted nucleotide-binding protein